MVNYLVTTLDDETFGMGTLADETADGAGLSLREAIALAALNGTDDDITFNLGGTLTLTNGTLTIAAGNNVTIDGDTGSDDIADVTINGIAAVGNIIENYSASSTLDAVFLTNGDNFAVFNSSGAGNTFTIINSTITGSEGGLSAQTGIVDVIDTTIFGNAHGRSGGGIFVFGAAVNVVGSTIEQNFAPRGGGIYAVGDLTITNSTISGNRADYGGGIFSGGDVTITNSTISGNLADSSNSNGGGIYNRAMMTIFNSTISGNYGRYGGGIYNAGGAALDLRNTIIAGNDAGLFEADLRGIPSQTGTNIIGTDIFDDGIDIGDTTLADIFATVVNVDPDGGTNKFEQGELADNGGPVQTILILDGGDAHNTGDNAALPADPQDIDGDMNTAETLPLDAIGNDRIIAATVDLGAVELLISNIDPVISIDDTTLAYMEDGLVQIDPAGTLTDDDENWDGGTLVVQITGNAEADDKLSIPDNVAGAVNTDGTNLRDGATVIGTLSAVEGMVQGGTALTITFNANATNALVQQVLRAVHYSSLSDNPGTADRTVTFTASDSNAANAADTRTISVTPKNDPPELTGDLAAMVLEGGTVVIGADDLGFGDPDDGAGDVTFTVTNEIRGAVLVDGMDQQTFTGQQLANGLVAFEHDGSDTATASFDVLVEDGDEDVSTPVAQTFNVTVTPVNDPPALTGDLHSTVLIGSTRVINAADLGFNDTDDDEDGVTFEVSALTNGRILVDGVEATMFTGAQLGDGLVAFEHDGSDTATASFDVLVEDGDEDVSSPVAQTFNLDIDQVNDPPVAQDDQFETPENQVLNGNLFDDNGMGQDDDPDNDPLTITQVNGAAGNVGNQILISGALLLVNADGTFSYDPNGAFLDLDPGESETEMVTYTIDDGNGGMDTASVEITVNGLINILTGTPDPDQLFGDLQGADQIDGLAGDDMLFGRGGDDILTGGAGNDVLDGGDDGRDTADYSQAGGGIDTDLNRAANQTRDDGDGGADSLVQIDDIIGSEFADVIKGDGGANIINGLGGDDTIRGRNGPDELLGGTGDDDIRGHKGQDQLLGEAGDDMLRGNRGSDTLLGGAGEDILRGGMGTDHLFGGTDDDSLTGGNGADIVMLEDNAGNDLFTDFQSGLDQISFANVTGVTSIADLTINQISSTVSEVDYFDGVNNVTLEVHSASAFTLNISDFVFV